MLSAAATPQQYIASLPPERKKAMNELRDVILKNLPEGYEEIMSYGMIGYVVPHKIYPAGYHANPKLPLGLMNIGSQKNYIILHHLGLYSSKQLLDWFNGEYVGRHKTKPDMGKGCVRFRKIDAIPLELIGELTAKLTTSEWITEYEKMLKKTLKK